MKKALLIIIGIISLVMACLVFFEPKGNFSDLFELVKFGFMSLFAIMGLSLIAFAIPDNKKNKDKKTE